jgi:rhamnulokinase
MSVTAEPVVVAIDLGAESCRVSLLRWTGGRPQMQLVHRFPNAPVHSGTHLRWDLQGILRGTEDGLRACAELAPQGISSIGVDGWAVDYVRLSENARPTADPFCYRDERTATSLKNVQRSISPERLYDLTGVQVLPLNTLYQLAADEPNQQSTLWVTLPEFLLCSLGGKRVAEYTNATTTQLLGVKDGTWCPEIFAAAGLDLKAAPPVVKPGTDVGRVEGALASLPAFRNTKLIAPACHDTASAIAGIPAQGNNWAFISSGTWSLVGCVLDSACLSAAARSKNFSNEGGVGGRIYFLKNVNGMWLVRQCIQHWQLLGQAWTVEELVEACRNLPEPDYLLDVDDPNLLLPDNMPARISSQLERASHTPIPEGPLAAPRVANLIFHSLAARYAEVLHGAANITGKKLERLYIVGGGSKNTLLNQLTAKATGLEVLTGATESATVGNFAVQLSALEGEVTSDVGVKASAVARWAGLLAGQAIGTSGKQAESALTLR